jgi:regulator of sigma E protease
MTWLVVIVGLMLLVFLHELGHFTVALLVGIRPRSFYVGFPPAIAKVKRNGIEYGLGAIPLGGLVRIPGMHRPAGKDVEAFMAAALRERPDLAPFVQRVRRRLDEADYEGAREALAELRREVEAAELSPRARRSAERALREIEEGTGRDAYWRQPPWKRIAVIAAGPLANVLVAFLLFFAVYLSGAPTGTATTKVEAVQAGSPAAAAGLRPGDRVVAVNGHPANTFDAVSRMIRASHGKPITVTVQRDGTRVTLGPKPTMKSGTRWIWGFAPGLRTVSYGPGKSAELGARDCWRVFSGTVNAIAGLFHSKQRAQVSGPVGIVKTSATALRLGFNWYVQVLGLISMSLAILNLLPLLPLDGGHILFSLIEAIRRRPVAREVYERVSMVGFAVILLIWFVALSNDFSGKGAG